MSWVALDARERVAVGVSRMGIDCGSKTVKVVVIAPDDGLVYTSYLRHRTNIVATLMTVLDDVEKRIGDFEVTYALTGSAAMHLADVVSAPFVQEVTATKIAVQQKIPDADVVIELGGEDSKILFLTGGEELRMNSSCAGGTGGFLDTMAGMLGTNAFGMAGLAEQATSVYPIASRCCVFAQNDVRGLLNQGAHRADIAASSLQAVVNQCVGGLACGRTIAGHVVFLGGPFHFLPQLVECFAKTLELAEGDAVVPADAHLYPAIGAALTLEKRSLSPEGRLSTLKKHVGLFTQELDGALPRLEPLFNDDGELAQFEARHEAFNVPRARMYGYDGPLFLGIDSGSTTMKAVLVDEAGRMLWWSYRYNGGDTLSSAKRLIAEVYSAIEAGRERAGEHAYIAKVVVTGYGEDVLLRSFNLDAGLVETVAHLKAAMSLEPEVDSVLDIGGQDIKWMKVRHGRVESISLNEACSSGCGALLGGFARNMQMSDVDFAREALFSKYPVDLGTRCTVFMTSRVRQAQKAGASAGDISAGLAYSVVKNALFKVMNLGSAGELGEHIVVQGGAFKSNALLRAFEKMVGYGVARSDYPELMGAFGAALHARDLADGQPSCMLDAYKASTVEVVRTSRTCDICGNGCTLFESRVTYDAGEAPRFNPMVACKPKVEASKREELTRVITGNRCTRPLGADVRDVSALDFSERHYRRIFQGAEGKPCEAGPAVGIPRCLGMYEAFPFWRAFFEALGVPVVVSDESSAAVYAQGMATIASESACHPAKLAHGHVINVVEKGAGCVFLPRVHLADESSLDCPVLCDYGTTLEDNLQLDVPVLTPRITQTPWVHEPQDEDVHALQEALARAGWRFEDETLRVALCAARAEQVRLREALAEQAAQAIEHVRQTRGRGVVLACRPYHLDPEVNHGISDLLRSYDLTVVPSDAIAAYLSRGDQTLLEAGSTDLSLWRLGQREIFAAQWAVEQPDFEIIHLYSFGCGVDATLLHELRALCEAHGREFTAFKMDEMVDMSSIRIRIRSLLFALDQHANAEPLDPASGNSIQPVAWRPCCASLEAGSRLPLDQHVGAAFCDNSEYACFDVAPVCVKEQGPCPSTGEEPCSPVPQRLFVPGWVPRIAPRIADALGELGVEVIVGQGNGLNTALSVANNDLCHLVLSAVGQSVEFARANDLEGFGVLLPLECPRCCSQSTGDVLRGIIDVEVLDIPGLITRVPASLGDLLVRALVDSDIEGLPVLAREDDNEGPSVLQKTSQAGADMLPVGIVGSAVLAQSPALNNDLPGLLSREGALAVMPSLATQVIHACLVRAQMATGQEAQRLTSFAKHCADYQEKELEVAGATTCAYAPATGFHALEHAAQRHHLDQTVDGGAGWLSPAMMLALLDAGLDTILFVQTFACLSSHVSGLGSFRRVREAYPDAHLASVEFDAALSQVNLVNRVKLLISSARR